MTIISQCPTPETHNHDCQQKSPPDNIDSDNIAQHHGLFSATRRHPSVTARDPAWRHPGFEGLPTPQLSGRRQDSDYPDLTITLQQSGTDFTISRQGDYHDIPVQETYQGTLEGRSIKLSYQALDEGQVRPVQGKCFGVASKDSSSLQLTGEDPKKGTVPLNLTKY